MQGIIKWWERRRGGDTEREGTLGCGGGGGWEMRSERGH